MRDELVLWFQRNQRDDGTIPYEYDPITRRVSDGNNELRQLMATRTLGELVRAGLASPDAFERNLAANMASWYRMTADSQHAYVLFDGRSKLGANAMLLRALTAAPDRARFVWAATAIATTIKSCQNPDGSFRAHWIVPPDVAFDDDYLLTFYAGEAILALLEYADAFSDSIAHAHAILSLNYYRDLYVAKRDQHCYPAYVPWMTMSLAHVYRETGDPSVAQDIFALYDLALQLLDRSNYVGRFYDPAKPQYGNPHASSDGVYTEGLAHAFEVAWRAGDDFRARTYSDALVLAIRNLERLQYDSAEVARLGFARDARGSIRVNAGSYDVRIDNNQHALDAILHLERVLRALDSGVAHLQR